ncbi:hypothetical protein D9758_017168 [Tetrapyrgos nigripes]|uniref:Uncharacterized protein n=1 Tax=Tetrapyrgos nigripes TaxID=182062 RepID=A0A8H5FIA5_9AGAR|nr:hypothetical protein D9758_017168 [Tetrapyrgos nigripes]
MCYAGQCQTCRRLNELSRLPIIWIEACHSQILSKGYPFPRCSLQELPQERLETLTRRAYRLAQRWLNQYHNVNLDSGRKPSLSSFSSSSSTSPSSLFPNKECKFSVSPSAPIADVRFIEGFEERFLLTVSKGIWSVITIWDVAEALESLSGQGSRNGDSKSTATSYRERRPTTPRKCCEWSPKGGLFTGLTLNSDLESEAKLAVSVAFESGQQIQLMNLSTDGQLSPICSIDVAMKPMTLEGDFIAMSDDLAQTTIYNWKTGDYAILKHLQDQEGVWKQDHCIQVVFAHQSILVVRARSVHLFPQPVLRPASVNAPVYLPIARHTFGWIDGVSVVPPSRIRPEVKAMGTTFPATGGYGGGLEPRHDFDDGYSESASRDSFDLPPPLTLLVRLQSDNPWTADEHSLDLYALMPSADAAVKSISRYDESNESQVRVLNRSHTHQPPPSVLATTPTLTVDADTVIPTLSDASATLSSSSSPPLTIPPPPTPYLFPPILTSRILSIRGSLRCTDVVLGPCRTAVWIRPHDRSLGGLIDDSLNGLTMMGMGGLMGVGSSQNVDGGDSFNNERSKEGLVCAVFPGPLCPSTSHGARMSSSSSSTGSTGSEDWIGGVSTMSVNGGDGEKGERDSDGGVRMMWMNELNNWTTLDYYEAMGRIALGSGDGYVTVLEL